MVLFYNIPLPSLSPPSPSHPNSPSPSLTRPSTMQNLSLVHSSSPFHSFQTVRTNHLLVTTTTRQVRCSAGSKGDDFYHRLSVGQTADQAEIKDAFRKQARKWHPDLCPSLADKEYYAKQFTNAKEAYDVLSDPVLRSIYDLKLRDDLEVYTITRPAGGLFSFLKREPISREELEAQLEGLRKKSARRAAAQEAKRGDELKEESGRLVEEEEQ